ncbi:hypothetical protein C8F04DRAFT_1100360 [Mycena alexandri]|uniref:Secreted protein n=1 Tax=Mycena alexandri TaxID=1745969 RepID=A0AAD6SW38_9AGAR|nr:hypothetical protein C8F04DRAFT_1100360 [Mycena alexandri]
MFFRALFVSTLVFVAAAVECPACAPTDLAGDMLVANSGGTRGTPRFCGYGIVVNGAGDPSVDCFYSTSGAGFSNNPASCPATIPIEDVC